MIKTNHNMGIIPENDKSPKLEYYIRKFWAGLGKIHCRTIFERIGNYLFPKSHFYYLKNKK